MTTEAQTCAIGTFTILNILAPLHLSRELYKSTMFMQNKPNLLYAQMNVISVKTKDYENVRPFSRGQNKPNSNPIQTQSNPISMQNKANQTQFSISIPTQGSAG